MYFKITFTNHNITQSFKASLDVVIIGGFDGFFRCKTHYNYASQAKGKDISISLKGLKSHLRIQNF